MATPLRSKVWSSQTSFTVAFPGLTDRVWSLTFHLPVQLARLNRASREEQINVLCEPWRAACVLRIARRCIGQRIALSEWSVTEPIWMHNLGFHEAALRRLGGPEVEARPQLMQPIPRETKENKKLRRLLSLAFTADTSRDREYRYKLSVAINELLFDKAGPLPLRASGPRFERVAGTAYPTMLMKGVADNVAIWPEFVDSCLSIKSVRYVEIERVEEGRLCTWLDLAIADQFIDGTIAWQDADGPEEVRRSHIEYTNGQWISRDGRERSQTYTDPY